MINFLTHTNFSLIAKQSLHCAKRLALASGLSSARKASFALIAKQSLHCKLRLLSSAGFSQLSSARNASFALLTTVSFALPRSGFALCIALLCSACSWMHEDVILTSETDYDPYVKMHSRAIEGSSVNARLFLWYENNYNIMSTLPYGQWDGANNDNHLPYWYGTLSSYIDAFRFDETENESSKKGTPYDTGQTWPDDNSMVYVMGVAPDDAFNWDQSVSTFDDLVIADTRRDGLSEILASVNDGTSRGSSTNPLVLPNDHEAQNLTPPYNEERELKFYHPTAAISFKGKRSPNMSNRIGVKNIRITINNKDANGTPYDNKIIVPTQLMRHIGTHNAVRTEYNASGEQISRTEQDLDAWTYVVNEAEALVPDEITGEFKDKLLMDLSGEDEAQELKTFYVLSDGINYGTGSGNFNPFVRVMNDNSKTPSLDISIYAEYFLTDNEKEIRCIQWNHRVLAGQNVWGVAKGADPTGDKFMPAHKYEVTLIFDSNSVGLRAELVPWEEEGPYYYPVFGTTDQTLFMCIANQTDGTDAAPVLDQVAKQRLYTPDNKLYSTIVDLEQGQWIGFFNYTKVDATTPMVLEHQALVADSYTSTASDYIGAVSDVVVNKDGKTTQQHHVKFTGEKGQYLVRYQQPLEGSSDPNLIYIKPYNTAADGFYFNEVKLADGPYAGCHGTPELVHLSSGTRYHLSQLKDGWETFLSLSGFNYDADHFEYDAPTKSLIFKDTATEGWYHIVYDDVTNNIASMLVATGKDGNTYSDIQTGFYFNKYKLDGVNSSGNYVFNTTTEKKVRYNEIVSITQIAEDKGTPVIAVSKFKNANASLGEIAYTVASGSESYFRILDDGCLRFHDTRTTNEFRFTINPNANTIACAYLSANYKDVYIVNGETVSNAAAYSLVVNLPEAGAEATVAITYTDNNYENSTVSLQSFTITGDVFAKDESTIKLSDDKTSGYYKLAFDFTASPKTITATRVRNDAGDPLLNRFIINDGSADHNVDGQYYYIVQTQNWTSSNDQPLTIKWTDGTFDTPGDVNYSEWTISTPDIFEFNNSSNPTALHLKSEATEAKYTITIDLWNHTISAEAVTTSTVWEDNKSFDDSWKINETIDISQAQAGNILRIYCSNTNDNTIIKLCKKDEKDGWVQIHEKTGTINEYFDYTIESDHVDALQARGLVIYGIHFTLTKIELVPN